MVKIAKQPDTNWIPVKNKKQPDTHWFPVKNKLIPVLTLTVPV